MPGAGNAVAEALRWIVLRDSVDARWARQYERAEMAGDDSIRIEGLSKAYGEFRALESVSLQVSPGEVFGVLGPNGAGKTTLMLLLMGLLVPSSGEGRIAGMDCFADRVALKRCVGYLPDTPFFYDYLTGWELLRFIADVHGLELTEGERRAERLLDELGLTDAVDDFVTSYSLGMKKKMALAMALIHEPRVLILDEPTAGLDPLSSRQIRRFLRGYADSGRIVLLSTHWLDMAESVCDRVGIIHHGRLVACGSMEDIHARRNAPATPGQSLEEIFLELTAPPEETAERG